MKYRLLLLIPLGFAALVVGGTLATSPETRVIALFRPEIMTVKLLAVCGTLMAAASFQRGDPLRRAWAANAGCYLFLFAMDLFFPPPVRQGPADLSPLHTGVHTVMATAGNASAVVGMLMFARVYRWADITLPGSATARRIGTAIAVAIASIILVPALFADMTQIAGGDYHGLAGLASDLGDFICFCVVVPIMLTAVALRGGLLVWPWAFLTACQLGWLLYDAVGATHFFDRSTARALEELFRTLACTSAMAAGIAQAWAVRGASGAPTR
jgi:hypothetical protein